jgi:hypothetical protein
MGCGYIYGAKQAMGKMRECASTGEWFLLYFKRFYRMPILFEIERSVHSLDDITAIEIKNN